MARATVEGVIGEVAEEMASPESAVPPPIGVESTWEANGMGPGSASLARMRREVEATLAEHAAAAMKLEAVMATLGVELVGSDVYSRVWELGPLVLAGDRLYSEMVTLLEWGRRRVLACWRRALCRPLRDAVSVGRWGRTGSHTHGLVLDCPVPLRCGLRAARRMRACRGYATACTGYRVRDVHAAVARRRTGVTKRM